MILTVIISEKKPSNFADDLRVIAEELETLSDVTGNRPTRSAGHYYYQIKGGESHGVPS